ESLKKICTDSFEKHLQQLINKKGLKNSEVYTAANISKQYFSKLLKGRVKPSKEKVLALAVGLRLNMDETIDFLRIAGYALSPISQTDRVVEYFIMQREYSVLKINIILFDFGLDPLTS
nr:helix-turn-helix transcriptional regulator [Lachnospiraceae bacterium]